MKKPKFLRRTWSRFSKLGKGRRKLQKWRRPTGRDNKMREKRKNRGAIVSIGYRQSEKIRGVVEGKVPVKIMNVKDLGKIGKNQIGIVGRVGKKKKIEIAKMAEEKKIQIYNLNKKKVEKKPEIKKTEKTSTGDKPQGGKK